MKNVIVSLLLALVPSPHMAEAGLFDFLGEPKDPGPAPRHAVFELGDIDDAAAKLLGQQLDSAKDSVDILIVIDSPGGDLYAAQSMAKALEKAAGEGARITCVVDGGALSAAFYVLESCPIRLMTARSSLMAHEPYFNGQPGVSITHDKLLTWDQALRAAARGYAEQCAARMGITADDFLARIRGKEWWLTPRDALAAGAVDGVVASPNAAMGR